MRKIISKGKLGSLNITHSGCFILSAILDSLRVKPPEISVDEASRIAKEYFNVVGEIKFLGGERDCNYHIRSENFETTLKIANVSESDAILELQCGALQHIVTHAADIPVPRVVCTVDDGNWATFISEAGITLRARMFTYLPGIPIPQGADDASLLFNLGQSVARVNKALRGYMHPAAQHQIAWNTQAFQQLTSLISYVENAEEKRLIEQSLQRFTENVIPFLGNCRSQVIHNDITYHNTVVDHSDTTIISGIYDFGDMVYGPIIQDLCNPAAEVPAGSRDPLSGSARIIAGFHSVLPLEDIEFRLLPGLMAARLASCLLLARWAETENSWTDERDHLDSWNEKCIATLKTILDTNEQYIENLFRSSCGLPVILDDVQTNLADCDQAWNLRQRHIGNANYFAYDKPLHIAKGEGVWLHDVSGKRYLDAYNNVPHAGHCHPRIVEAICRQTALLNTNTRYIYDVANQYAEQITATLPEELDTCYFVSSGSEANDLAWRLATSWTGNSAGLVLDNAYHGITDITFALSPAEYRSRNQSFPHIATFSAPDDFRGQWKRDNTERGRHYAQHVESAIEDLNKRNLQPSVMFLDMIMSSNGIFSSPPGYLEALFERVRQAGAICVADEVQSGFGRLGDHMWGFQFGNVIPDIVTFGKPIAGGYPMGLVVTRKEIAQKFEQDGDFFSTTGGNPVACAAALAMLDVLRTEGLINNAQTVGQYMSSCLRDLSKDYPTIGDIRGSGLFVGVEIITDTKTCSPDGKLATRIVNRLAHSGVLIGLDGIYHNVLKIRPPMIFKKDHVDLLIDRFRNVLEQEAEQYNN